MRVVEQIITKLMNTAQPEPVAVPTLGAIEAEELYLSRLEALDAEERHIRRQLQERRPAPRWGLD